MKSVKMMIWMLLINIVCVCTAETVIAQQTPNKKGYAPVNNQKIYYEEYGSGKPLILLHGAFMNIQANWAHMIPELSKTNRVIAIELQCHGRTAIGPAPFNFDNLASDVADVCRYLKLDSLSVIGYSLGAAVAYNVAIKYPELVKNLVIISGVHKSTGWQKEGREALAGMEPEMFAGSELYTSYAAIAPDSTKWKEAFGKIMGLSKKPYDFGDENVRNIKAKTLLIAGDNDGTDKAVLIDTYKLLGGCQFADLGVLPKNQLAILPGHGHVSVMNDKDKLLALITPFLSN